MNIEKLQELERLTAAASGDDPPLGAMTAFFNAMEPATVAELIVATAAQPAPLVDGAGERAPASAAGSVDTPAFRELAYAYAKAVCLKTSPAQDKARASLIAHIDDQVAAAYDAGRQAGMSDRVALSADGNSVFIDGESDVALARAAAPAVGALTDAQIGQAVQRGYVKIGERPMYDCDLENVVNEVREALAASTAQPGERDVALREALHRALESSVTGRGSYGPNYDGVKLAAAVRAAMSAPAQSEQGGAQ